MAWASSPTTVRPVPSGAQRAGRCRPAAVDVLVLVDQHVVEAAAPARGRARRRAAAPASTAAGRRGRAVPGPLAAHVGLDHAAIGSTRSAAPRARLADLSDSRPARVDRARVEVEQRSLARRTAGGSGPGPAPRAPGPAGRRRRPGRGRRSRRQAERGRVGGDDPVPTAWNVPPHAPARAGRLHRSSARPSISAAARRVNVSSSIALGRHAPLQQPATPARSASSSCRCRRRRARAAGRRRARPRSAALRSARTPVRRYRLAVTSTARHSGCPGSRRTPPG